MGPENYAFWVGNDMVIALDNIIYDAKRKYKEGYADHVLRFVKGLLKYVPMSSDLYVAQHSPVLGRVETRTRIINATDLISMLRGHKVTFISGHNHVNDHFEFEKDITEQNVAAICGAWWDTQHCKDGTPRGYKVFTKKDGKLSWYFKAEGHDKDFQVEIFKPGQMPMHPNSVVANVWDWDPQWKVEWYEDGQYMGTMDRVTDLSPLYTQEINKAYEGKTISDYKKPAPAQHYFAATPSQYAKKVMVTVESRFGKSWVYEVDMTDYVDVQAHRGGAGLMPENTIEAMKHCLDMGVNTLEMDFVLSGDGKVVVSHESYFHHRYTTRPDGSLVQKADPKEYLYKMTYDQIAKYDVGVRANDTYPDKACVPAVKPLAEDLITFVENYTKENGLSPVRYNIEIKSSQADGQSINWANYDKLADAIMRLLVKFHLDDRLVVQCFDARTLNYIQPKYPEINFSYLISNKTDLDFDGYMALLKFTPKWLSPHHSLVNEELIAKCREKGMKIVPWTVDKPEDIKRMIDLKVDAIISNYPDRVLMQTRGY
jgi:glycerophosphoryl diester phosphodiesterase